MKCRLRQFQCKSFCFGHLHSGRCVIKDEISLLCEIISFKIIGPEGLWPSVERMAAIFCGH